MALLPRSTTTLKETGGGQALDRDLAVILSCMQSGTDENLQAFTSVQDIQDMHGYGEGLELAARYVTDTDLAVMFGKLATVTAGAIGPTNVKSVTGTSAITFSGTPYDDEAIQVVVVTGGTIGVAGIELKISRDGGRTFGARMERSLGLMGKRQTQVVWQGPFGDFPKEGGVIKWGVSDPVRFVAKKAWAEFTPNRP